MSIEGPAEISTTNTKSLSGLLILEGGAVWTAGVINIFNGGLMRNVVSSIFEVQNAVAMSLTNSSGGTGHVENLGTFITQGAGLLSVSGTLIFNNEGTIRGIGTITNSSTFTNTGILAPGLSPGIITLNGAQPLSVSSTLQIEIQDGSGAGTGHDQLVRSGNLTLAGTISVTETGAVPDALYTVIHLTSGTISGSFSSINVPAGYVLHQLATQVILAKNVVLPLTLLAFTAEKTSQEKVFLRWTTTDEQALSHFEVQRSRNPTDFVSIGHVAARNTSGEHAYRFTDDTPLSATNYYYRLRMVDIDGQARFSPIRVVKLNASAEIKVYPTVTAGRIFVEVPEETILRFFSASGLLLHAVNTTGITEMDISHFPPDVYILHFGDEAGSVRIFKY
jgi:hypothetical protein